MNFPLGKKNYQSLTASDLKSIIESQPDSLDAVIAYCNKVLTDGGPSAESNAANMIRRFKAKLVEEADPLALATIILQIPLTQESIDAVHYLRLGGRLEASRAIDQAGLCYRRVFDLDKHSKESEVALRRLAKLLELEYHNPDQAREAYDVFLTLFPASVMAEEVRKAVDKLPPPTDGTA